MKEIIKSKDNPTIKLYQKLSMSKKERKNLSKFVLEGQRLVSDALNENAELTHLLITENTINKYIDEISQADLKNVKIITISNELGNKISSTEKTQGIFAICSMPPEKSFELEVAKGGKFIVLHKIQDPGNMGMIIRTADAVGVDGVIIAESCDLYSPKVIRSTMGSVFRMKIWRNMQILEVIKAMKKYNIETCAAVIDKNAKDIRDYKFNDNCAVLIGNEGNGLDKKIVMECNTAITIKMKGSINSLNAAMAAGIIMWEIMGG